MNDDAERERERRAQVVQSVKNNVKLLEPVYVILGFLDIRVDWEYLDIGVEWGSRLSSDLLNVINCQT